MKVWNAYRHFNPRSPWGERHKELKNMNPELEISIHAPRGGSDERFITGITGKKDLFQSTLPVGGATRGKGYQKDNLKFQSTLPVGGATAKMHSFTCISLAKR